MSVLTLDGVRYSEQQLMASGVSQMFILFNINKSKPLRRISRIPAPDNIISAYALVSLALQVLVHVLIMSLLVHLLSTEKTTVPFDVKFQPSLVNTVVFLLGMYQDLAINVVNYPGEPYMLSLTQFKKLWRGVIVSVVATLVLTMQWLPELNEALGLITMDGHVQRTVMTLAYSMCCYVSGLRGRHSTFWDQSPSVMTLRQCCKPLLLVARFSLH